MPFCSTQEYQLKVSIIIVIKFGLIVVKGWPVILGFALVNEQTPNFDLFPALGLPIIPISAITFNCNQNLKLLPILPLSFL